MRMWMRIWLVVMVALPLLAGSPGWANGSSGVLAQAEEQYETRMHAQSGDIPRFEEGSCPEDIQARIPPGETARCGKLIVPERYDQTEGKTIELDVMIIPAINRPTAPDPVVFAQGGPGGSTIDYFSQVLFTSQIRANRDFVLFDQRGTLYTRPSLFCQEIFDEGIRTLNIDLPAEESERLFRESALACRQRLVKEGVDLSAFNSIENARDIESLRQALGYTQINLYGVSYGTLLALHAMRENPEGLRSVILDAVVPTNIDFNFDAPNSQNRAFKEFFDACRSQPVCDAAYPNLEQSFYDLVARLEEKPATIRLLDSETGKTYPSLLDGDSLVSALFQMLYVTDFIPLLPRMIYATAEGRYAFLESVFSQIIFDRTMNYGMYFSVVCSEDGTVDPGYRYDGVRPEIAKDVTIGNRSLVELCNAWQVTQIGDAADIPVVSDVPTLIFNGRFDPITPPAYGEEAAKTLSQSYLFTFPNTGHGALTSGQCAASIFLEFLSNPVKRPDGSCIESIPPVKFVLQDELVDLPVVIQIATLKGPIVGQLIAFVLAWLGLLSAAVVFPVGWLIRLARRREGRPTPALAHLAPWLPFMNAGVLLALAGGLFYVLILLVQAEDFAPLYFGIPSRYGALLILAFFSLLLTLATAVLAAAGWGGRYWSTGRKIYYTLLALCAITTAVLLAIWGFFSAL